MRVRPTQKMHIVHDEVYVYTTVLDPKCSPLTVRCSFYCVLASLCVCVCNCVSVCALIWTYVYYNLFDTNEQYSRLGTRKQYYSNGVWKISQKLVSPEACIYYNVLFIMLWTFVTLLFTFLNAQGVIIN